jgi:hypothetical protein
MRELVPPTESAGQFEEFRRAVFADPDLQRRLQSISDWPEFVEVSVEAAAGRGITLTDGDLLAARDTSWRSWLERWI